MYPDNTSGMSKGAPPPSCISKDARTIIALKGHENHPLGLYSSSSSTSPSLFFPRYSNMPLMPSESPAEARPLVQSTTIGHFNASGIFSARRTKILRRVRSIWQRWGRRMRGDQRGNVVRIVDVADVRKVLQNGSYLLGGRRWILGDLYLGRT